MSKRFSCCTFPIAMQLKTFIRRWGASVTVQALGPMSSLATVLVVARLGGAAAQGSFAQTKAWIDLLVVLGCFGFPQGIVYVTNKLGASAHRLAWHSVAYSLAFLPVSWAITFLGTTKGWTGQTFNNGGVYIFASALAGALLVLHGLLRGVYLSRQQGASFALFSILPAITLLVAIFITRGKGYYANQILVSAFVSAIFGVVLTVVQLRCMPVCYAETPWRALFANSTHSFVQSMLMVLQPLLSYALLRAADDYTQVGYLNAGIFLSQGLIVPVGLISPLMFAHWTSRYDAGLLWRLRRQTIRWVMLGIPASLFLAIIAQRVTPLIFGRDYLVASTAVALMVCSVPQALHSRLLAPALHAQGFPGVNTICAGVRLAGLALFGWLLSQSGVSALNAAALGWSVGELLSLAWVLWMMHRLDADNTSLVKGGR